MLAQPRLLSWLRHKPSKLIGGSFHSNNQDPNTDSDTDADSDTEKSIPYYAFRFVKPKPKFKVSSSPITETSPVHATFSSAFSAGLDQAEHVLRRVGVGKRRDAEDALGDDGDDEASSSSSSEAPSTPSLASPSLSSSPSVENSGSKVDMAPSPFSRPGSLYIPTYKSRSKKESTVAHATAAVFRPFGSLFLPFDSHKKNTDIKCATNTSGILPNTNVKANGRHRRLFTAELASDDDEVFVQPVRGKHAGFLTSASPSASVSSGPRSALFFSYGSVSGGFDSVNSVNDCDEENDDLEDESADEFDIDLEACVRSATDEEGDDECGGEESSECSSDSASIASRTGPPPTPVLDYSLLPRLVTFEDAELDTELDALDSLKTFAPPAVLLPRTTIIPNANAVRYTCLLKVKGKDADVNTDTDTVRPSSLFTPPRAKDLLRMTGPMEVWNAPLDVVRFVSTESTAPPPAHARAHALHLSPFSRDPFGPAMMQPFCDQEALFADEDEDEAGDDDEEFAELASASVFDPSHTRDAAFSRDPFPADESTLSCCPVDSPLPAGVLQQRPVVPRNDSFDDFPVCEMSRAMGLHG